MSTATERPIPQMAVPFPKQGVLGCVRREPPSSIAWLLQYFLAMSEFLVMGVASRNSKHACLLVDILQWWAVT